MRGGDLRGESPSRSFTSSSAARPRRKLQDPGPSLPALRLDHSRTLPANCPDLGSAARSAVSEAKQAATEAENEGRDADLAGRAVATESAPEQEVEAQVPQNRHAAEAGGGGGGSASASASGGGGAAAKVSKQVTACS